MFPIKKVFGLFVLIFGSSLCTDDLYEYGFQKIIGGSVVKESELERYYFMAGISYQVKPGIFKHICGAAILSQHFVVTAAHCFFHKRMNIRPHNYFVYFNTRRPGTYSEEIFDQMEIEKIIVHESFSHWQKTNDIAIIKLSRGFDPIRQFVSRVVLNHSSNITTDQQIRIFGYGNGNGYLKHAVLNVEDAKRCNDIYSQDDRFGITEKQFCLRVVNVDSQPGDSGGPGLLFDDLNSPKLAGIMSFGQDQKDSQYVKHNSTPAVYTNVRAYIDWIKDVVLNNKPCRPDILYWEFIFVEILKDSLRTDHDLDEKDKYHDVQSDYNKYEIVFKKANLFHPTASNSHSLKQTLFVCMILFKLFMIDILFY